jgi:hypothetical protein
MTIEEFNKTYRFQVTNFHSKEALKKAISKGVKVTPKPIPLTKAQLLQNKEFEASGKLPPYPTPSFNPLVPLEITSGNNKQVPFWTATVTTNKDGIITEVK